MPFLSKTNSLCFSYLENPFSVLSLGNILVPGISLNYAISFDIVSKNKPKVYFIANIIGRSNNHMLSQLFLIAAVF